MNTKEFKKYLDKAKKVICSKNSLPILDNIMFSNGRMFVSDLEVEYSYKNDIFEGISGCVDFKTLHKIISKLKNVDFELKANEIQLTIETSKGKFNLELTQLDNTVFMPECNEKIGQLTNEHLPLIKKALNYTSKYELRPVLSRVLLEPNKIVATDAHRLCFYGCENIANDNVLIRKKVANTIDFECEILANGSLKNTSFTNGIETITQRTPEETFPSWRSVVPEISTNILKCESKDMLEKLELAKIAGNDVSQLIELRLCQESKIVSSDIDINTSFIADINEYKGEEMAIGFKNDLLQSIIKTEKTEYIEMSFSDPSRAALINGNVILMPMMIG